MIPRTANLTNTKIIWISVPKKLLLICRWTFLGIAGLDRTLSLEDALLLFFSAHGERLTQEWWQRFLTSREDPKAPVHFEEVKFWLIDRPDGVNFMNKDALAQELARLHQNRLEDDSRTSREMEALQVT